MKFWFRYLKEKRVAILLYFVTVLIFLTVGVLSRTENMGDFLYGAVLALFFWALAGAFGGVRYVRKSRKLEEVIVYFDRFPELITENFQEMEGVAEEAVSMANLEGDLVHLLELVCGQWAEDIRQWEEKNADRSDYYVMWTHQIKTPIAAMRLLLESSDRSDRKSYMLRAELFQIEQYAEMALAYQRLESLASDLLLQEYDLGTMLRHVAKKYSVLFIHKGLTLDIREQNVSIVTDEKWFCFCMEQLLSNSVKYTNTGRISIWTEESDEGTRLLLEDTGLGIRPEDLPRIFERGFTGYNGRLDKKSTGIGLYLCRRVLDHLGISITVESEVGKGTKVVLLLVGTKNENAFI